MFAKLIVETEVTVRMLIKVKLKDPMKPALYHLQIVDYQQKTLDLIMQDKIRCKTVETITCVVSKIQSLKYIAYIVEGLLEN